MTIKHPILGFKHDDETGVTRIDTTILSMFAGVELRKFERLLETDQDPGARQTTETVAGFRALDATLSSLLSLAEELASDRSKPKPAPQQITRTRFVERDARGLIVATEDRDSDGE